MSYEALIVIFYTFLSIGVTSLYQHRVLMSQILGKWHVQRQLRGTSGGWNSAVAEIVRAHGSGHMIRVLYCAAVQRQCAPTQVLTLAPLNDDYSEWRSLLPAGAGMKTFVT